MAHDERQGQKDGEVHVLSGYEEKIGERAGFLAADRKHGDQKLEACQNGPDVLVLMRCGVCNTLFIVRVSPLLLL